MLKTTISDTLKGNQVRVTDYLALRTHVFTDELLPIGESNRMRPFFLKADVHNGGTDGSSTPVDFDLLTSDISATFDYYIQTIAWVVSDGTQNYSKFGAISALSTGCDLLITVNGEISYLGEKIKTGGELLLWSISSSVSSNPGLISGWSTNDDALIGVYDMKQQIPGTGGLSGLRIGRGSKDKVSFIVNDNLSALSDHFLFIKGFKLYA